MRRDEEQRYISEMRHRLSEYIKQSGATQQRIAKELNVSKATVSLFMSGTYTGNNLELAKNIEQFLRIGAARQATAKVPDICLVVGNTVEIGQKARIAHVQNTIALIYGPAGCGKTTALQHYVCSNNGVVYVEADATVNSPRCILKLILNALGEDMRGSTADMMQRILAKLTGTNRLLIIDEAQHLTEKSFDTIRAINDKAHIGIVYAGNPSILKRMYGRQAEEFDQVYSRTVYKCRLTNDYTQEDIDNLYAKQDFSRECLKYLYQISKRKGGLRLMVNQCRIAQNIALSMGEVFTVSHLEEAATKMGISHGT